MASQCFTNILGGDGDADGVKVVLELLPSVTAFWDGNSVCFAMGSALSLRVVLLWGAAHYDPPFFNDCRRELPEESL